MAQIQMSNLHPAESANYHKKKTDSSNKSRFTNGDKKMSEDSITELRINISPFTFNK